MQGGRIIDRDIWDRDGIGGINGYVGKGKWKWGTKESDYDNSGNVAVVFYPFDRKEKAWAFGKEAGYSGKVRAPGSIGVRRCGAALDFPRTNGRQRYMAGRSNGA